MKKVFLNVIFFLIEIYIIYIEYILFLKKQKAKEIIFACLLAAPEGLKKIIKDHPDTIIFSASLDRQLNKKGYILPGLGDAGDRTFGTL